MTSHSQLGPRLVDSLNEAIVMVPSVQIPEIEIKEDPIDLTIRSSDRQFYSSNATAIDIPSPILGGRPRSMRVDDRLYLATTDLAGDAFGDHHEPPILVGLADHTTEPLDAIFVRGWL